MVMVFPSPWETDEPAHNRGGTAINELLECYNNPAYRNNSIYPFGTEHSCSKAFPARHYSFEESERDLSRTLLSLAGFQVIISGRFWVIAEARIREGQAESGAS